MMLLTTRGPCGYRMGGTRTLIKGGKVDHLRNAEPGYIVRQARIPSHNQGDGRPSWVHTPGPSEALERGGET